MLENNWIEAPVASINNQYKQQAEQHQNSLTKPPGSLGRIEELSVLLAAMQSTVNPTLNNVHITVFAADHGIAEENVSAFPQVVTVEMVKNFACGGAAISVLAKQLGATLDVINVGTVNEHDDFPQVTVNRIAAGTQNFSLQQAMSLQQLQAALNTGQQSVEKALKESAQLYIGGDMGIANTTSATAIACVLLGETAEKLAGPGTGLNNKGILHKVKVIEKSLALHNEVMQTPLDVLQCVGGFEISALAGAYIACAQKGLPVLVDGFISSVAALAAIRLSPHVRQWMFFSHASAEPGHKLILNAMNASPLLALNMRLGEASGAAMVVPLMRMACALHNEMATFEQAQVSVKNQANEN